MAEHQNWPQEDRGRSSDPHTAWRRACAPLTPYERGCAEAGRIDSVRPQVVRVWYESQSRRSHSGYVNGDRMTALLNHYPLPSIHVSHVRALPCERIWHVRGGLGNDLATGRSFPRS